MSSISSHNTLVNTDYRNSYIDERIIGLFENICRGTDPGHESQNVAEAFLALLTNSGRSTPYIGNLLLALAIESARSDDRPTQDVIQHLKAASKIFLAGLASPNNTVHLDLILNDGIIEMLCEY